MLAQLALVGSSHANYSGALPPLYLNKNLEKKVNSGKQKRTKVELSGHLLSKIFNVYSSNDLMLPSQINYWQVDQISTLLP